MKRSEIYLKAAAVIRTNGHYKGDYFSYPESSVGICPSRTESPVCAVGALSLVVTGDPVPDTDQLRDLVADFAGRAPLASYDESNPISSVADWNDADRRTADDVIASFEQAAREVA